MWEAFLLQMNDFDRLLESQLRHMLDPIVAAPAPSRGGRRPRARKPILAIGPKIELTLDTILVVEPAVVTVPVAAPPL